MPSSRKKKKKQHPLLWVVESLMEEPSYLEKLMFGCLAIYLHGRLMIVLASGEEPWDGLMIPTDYPFHQDIMEDFPDVVQHSVFKKWLYLPEAREDFNTAVLQQSLLSPNLLLTRHTSDFMAETKKIG